MPKPLDKFPVIRTQDAEKIRATLLNLYGAHELAFPEGTTGLVGHGNYVQLRHLSLSYCSYGAAVQLSFPESDYVRQQFGIRGRGATTASGITTEINERQSCVTPSHAAVRLDSGNSFEQMVLRVPAKLIDDTLSSLLGARHTSKIEFQRISDTATARGRHLRNLVLFLARTLDESGNGLPRQAIEELEQSIAVAFLYCTNNSLNELLERDPADVAPWQVRRVEEYIEANWSKPLTMEELAKAVDASVRSIFKTFGDYRGYTPMGFLRDIRLTHARAMLMNPKTSESVTAVGFACGFLSLGHFARYYRLKFGELPSDTLSRAKGHRLPQKP